MKLIGIIVTGIGVSVALLALVMHPAPFDAEASKVADDFGNLVYQDACVVQVTHPELQIELTEVLAPNNGCTNCRYMFRIWNQTAAVGTKAYRTTVAVVPFNYGMELNGRAIATLKLHGYVTELKTLHYSVLQNEDFFAIEGLCPGCLFPDQARIKILIEYHECAGIRRYECVFDLRSYAVTVINQVFEPCVGCNCD